MSARDDYKPRRFKDEGKPRHESKKNRVAKHFGMRHIPEDKVDQLDEMIENELIDEIPELNTGKKRNEIETAYDFGAMPDPDWEKMIPASKDVELAQAQEKAERAERLAELNHRTIKQKADETKTADSESKTEAKTAESAETEQTADVVIETEQQAQDVASNDNSADIVEPENGEDIADMAKTEGENSEENADAAKSETAEQTSDNAKETVAKEEKADKADENSADIEKEAEATPADTSDKKENSTTAQPETAENAENAKADTSSDSEKEPADKTENTDSETVADGAENAEQATEEQQEPKSKRESYSTEEEVIRNEKMRKAFAEDYEYVSPIENYTERIKNKHKHHNTLHTGKTKMASDEELLAESEGYVFPVHRKHHHHHHHHSSSHKRGWWKRRSRVQRILLIILAVLLALIIALGASYYVLMQIGYNSMHNYDNFGVEAPTADESGNDIIMVDNSGRVITYDGVSYEFNDDIMSVTLIGTDDGSEEFDGLHMSDAIYIIAVDSKTGKVTILGISRDTMADVDIYSDEGNYIDTERMQIAYTYAYGNGSVTGGQNTLTTLSRLFYGLPLDNYFAINLQALTTLNDTIGGVTLTSSITFESPVDGRTINAGENVTLHGREANYYVRNRDVTELESNNDRMQRQQEYIIGFLNSVIPAARKDISIVNEVYNEIDVNSDTNLDLAEMTYLASTAVTTVRSASDVEYVNLVGEITEGEHAEMNLTDEQIIRTMLDIFYTPLAEVPDI